MNLQIFTSLTLCLAQNSPTTSYENAGLAFSPKNEIYIAAGSRKIQFFEVVSFDSDEEIQKQLKHCFDVIADPTSREKRLQKATASQTQRFIQASESTWHNSWTTLSTLTKFERRSALDTLKKIGRNIKMYIKAPFYGAFSQIRCPLGGT